MVIALEVASGDSFVTGTEPDIGPDILASVGTRAWHGAWQGCLYDIMWEQPASWPVMGQDTLWATLFFIGH